jgi:2-keto-3-deoxy-L-rhamnonate aldolase RhmA
MKSSLKQRLARGEVVRVMILGALAHPKLVELAALVGNIDGIWFDQEHSALTQQQLEVLLLACRAAGIEGFVRIAPTDYATVMRPLETGASGVMAAQIRTVAEAEQVVRWASYPPQGVRGLFQGNFEAGYGTIPPRKIIDRLAVDRWLVIQIETPEAVDCVDGIAQIEGVDCLFVGPGDLACTLGVPGEVLHPKCVAALERVAAAAKAAGKPWGVLSRSAEHAALCRNLGCQLFSLTGDIDLVLRGFQSAHAAYPELFPPAARGN